MTVSFGTYPAGHHIVFVRATFEDVRWVMEEFPEYWRTLPGNPPHKQDHGLYYQEFFHGPSTPRDWLNLLQPQNYDDRVLIIDVDLPGWIAVLVDSRTDYQAWTTGFGLFAALARRNNFSWPTDTDGVATIRVGYEFHLPETVPAIYTPGDMLKVEVASTTVRQPWTHDSTYLEQVPWFLYSCMGRGWPGYDGLDVPLMNRYPPEWEHQAPDYMHQRQGNHRAFNFTSKTSRDEDEEFRKSHLRLLPFDPEGHDRVVDFFSTTIVEQWLRERYGIRWDDPTFYQGESALYIVGAPGGIQDPFVPRIPIETYYRFQGIDLERNQDLIDRGRF